VLVTEWPAAEKANLEAQIGQGGAVAVEFSGCELRLLPECRLPGLYTWSRTTPSRDVIEIRDEADLYTKLPLGAATLAGELRHSGALSVTTTVAGQLRLSGMTPSQVTAAPECARATHLLGGLSLGAFELSAGSHTTGSGSVGMSDASLGGSGSRSQRTMRTAGNPASCADATDDAAAPDCASPIQAFLEPIPGRAQEPGPPGSVEVDIVSSDASTRWDVFVDGDASCTTPCSRWLEPGRPLELRTRQGTSSLTVENLPRDQGPQRIVAHPTSMGPFVTGIVFTALGGMATITGTVLTGIHCGDGGAGCTAGLITLGAGSAVTAGAIVMLVGSLSDVEVRPLFERDASVQLTPTGIRGHF
jgi:hypothetical protein